MRRRHDTGIVFRDFLLLMLLAMLVMINPPENKNIRQPGDMLVSIAWEAGNYDVDLWVLGPGDPVAVGYKRKSGATFNLLRDDRGENDTTPLNYETAFSRGIPDGEYVVNIHCFACGAPIGVFVEVRIGRSGSDLVYSDTITVKPMQELTAISFLVSDGKAVPGSESYIFQPLRNRT